MEKEITKIKEDIERVQSVLNETLMLMRTIDKESFIIQSESDILSRMLKVIELPKDEYSDNVNFFEDFDVLSAFLESDEYNDLAVYKIIKYLINKNIDLGIEKRENIVDAKKIIEFPFEGLTRSEVREMMSTENLRTILTNSEKSTEKEQIFYEQIIEHINELKIDNLDQVKKSNIILNNYFTLLENEYTLEDIDIILESLKKLKVSVKICTTIKRYMEKKLYKRVSKIDKKESQDKYIYSTKNSKKYLTDTEYKNLLKKVKEIYDAYNMKLKRNVNYEEMMNTVSAMVQLGYDESEINRFVKLARASFETDKIEITTFIENYDRYLYYLGTEEVQDLLDYLEQMMITNDEDYSFWKVSFLEETEKANEKIKYKQGYEYQKYKNID